MTGNFADNGDFQAIWRDLLHAADLRHRTDGFNSPRKEGMLRIFSHWKIRQLRPGSNPRTWVPETSMLSPDHRSRLRGTISINSSHGATVAQRATAYSLIEASLSHPYTPQSVGLLWTNDRPVAETSTWQHTTLKADRYMHDIIWIRTRNPSK
jgi:hypothetical protein